MSPGHLPDGPIVVTGAAGFLGAAVVQLLLRVGCDVRGVDRRDAPNVYRLDVTDAARVVDLCRRWRPAAIVHAGAVSGPMVMPQDPATVWRVNVQGAANVLEAARRAGVARVVLLSSIDIYGSMTGEITEDVTPAPETVYGASKVAAEAALVGYRREHGLAGMALRMAWVVGPGRRTPTTLSDVAADLAAGRGLRLPDDPAVPAPYLHVEDAARAVALALACGDTHQMAYNIAPTPTLPLATHIRALAGARRVRLPDAFRIDRAEPRRDFAIDRAAGDLGWRPALDPTEPYRAVPGR